MFLDNIIKKQKQKDNEEAFKEEISKCVDIEYLYDLMEETNVTKEKEALCNLGMTCCKVILGGTSIFELYNMIICYLNNSYDITTALTNSGFIPAIMYLGYESYLHENMKENLTYRKWKLDIIQKRLYELKNVQSEMPLNEFSEQSKEKEESQKLNLNRLK